jgi:hypothetical protein
VGAGLIPFPGDQPNVYMLKTLERASMTQKLAAEPLIIIIIIIIIVKLIIIRNRQF